MADDDEWAKFQAEIAAVEHEPAADGPAAAALPPPTLPPPALPPPTRPPVSAVAQAPPVVRKPPAPAHEAGHQFSAPPHAPPPIPPPMGGPGHGYQQGMMQQGMGMGMGGMGMGGMGGGGMGMGGGYGGGMGMGMGMGGGGMGMGGMGMQQQQQQQQQQAGAGAGAGGSKPGQKAGGKKKVLLREAGGEKWVDPSLNEWPDNDFRIFVGDLGNEVTDDLLSKSFSKYSSFAKAKIVRDARTKKSKGYGFVSFMDSADFAKALREMQGKYIGNRPCKLTKSSWDERTIRKVNLREPPAKKQKQ